MKNSISVAKLASGIICEERLVLPTPKLEVRYDPRLIKAREIHFLASEETRVKGDYLSIVKSDPHLKWYSEGSLSYSIEEITITGRFDAAYANRRYLKRLIERKTKPGKLPTRADKTAIFQAALYAYLHELNRISAKDAVLEIFYCSQQLCPLKLIRNRIIFCVKHCSFSKKFKIPYLKVRDYMLKKLNRFIGILKGAIKPMPTRYKSVCEMCYYREYCPVYKERKK